MRLEFSRQVFEKSSNVKCYENHSSGSRVFRWGRTDVTKRIVDFCDFVNKSKNSRIPLKFQGHQNNILEFISALQKVRCVLNYKYQKFNVVSASNNNNIFFLLWRRDPTRVLASSFLMFLDHTQRRTTVGRTPLDEWSARRRDLCLTTHNTHNKHPCPRWDTNPRSQQASGNRPTP